MKWYAVPTPSKPETNFLSASDRPAQIVDEYGFFVAEFQRLRDAEAAAAFYNAPTSKEVAA